MSNLHDKQKLMADAFTAQTGVYSSYCKSCEHWVVHCPECFANWCGTGCDCGYAVLLTSKQSQLDDLMKSDELTK